MDIHLIHVFCVCVCVPNVIIQQKFVLSRADPRIFACVVPKYAQKMFWLKNNNLHLYTSVWYYSYLNIYTINRYNSNQQSNCTHCVCFNECSSIIKWCCFRSFFYTIFKYTIAQSSKILSSIIFDQYLVYLQ